MEEERKFTVYMHTCPNGKRYIGMTSLKPERRWNNGKGYTKREKFWTDIQLFGWENIKHEILKSDLTLEEVCYWEKYYIKKYNTTNPEFGYNTTEGGEKPSMVGKHRSEEFKEKCRQAHLGEKHSREHNEKIGKSQLGRKHSREHNEKIGKSQLGRKHSEETKEKLKQLRLGMHWYNDGKEEIPASECPIGFVPGRLKKANK